VLASLENAVTASIFQEQPMVDKDQFLHAMSSLAGTIHVVATVEAGVPIGVIATSVCSLSADPPSLVVCLNKSTSAHDPILRRKLFTVHVLAASQADVARKFMTEKGVERFSHESWKVAPGRMPELDTALATFDCELANSYDGYSHSILIGKVVNLGYGNEASEQDCLIWHMRHFARPAAVL
jgi:flavin reductase